MENITTSKEALTLIKEKPGELFMWQYSGRTNKAPAHAWCCRSDGSIQIYENNLDGSFRENWYPYPEKNIEKFKGGWIVSIKNEIPKRSR